MASLADVRALIGRGGHYAVVSVTRADGSIHSTVVSAGLTAHPVTGEETAAFTTAGGTAKLRFLRGRARAALVFRDGYHWASVEGPVDLVGYGDPFPGVDEEGLRSLLRAVFTAAGGTHDNWPEYDRAMADQRRSAVLVRPERIFAM